MNLDRFDSDFEQMFSGLRYVKPVIAFDDTTQTWRAPDGDIVRVTGTGIQEDGLPITDSFTKVEIAKDGGDIDVLDITISDIQDADFARMEGLDNPAKQDLFWDDVMRGDVTFTAPEPRKKITAYLDKRIIRDEIFMAKK